MSIHPHLFRSVLGQHRSIVEYQVQQTAHGADIRLVTQAQIDVPLIRQVIVQALAAAGLDQPQVTVTLQSALDRLETGKLKRFVSLPG